MQTAKLASQTRHWMDAPMIEIAARSLVAKHAKRSFNRMDANGHELCVMRETLEGKAERVLRKLF